jgi:hypothetical protein
MIRRLLHALDRLVTRRLAREFTRAGVPTRDLTAVGAPRSVSPLSLVDRYHLTGLPNALPPQHWACCGHCPKGVCPFAPHPVACPEPGCQRGAS